MAFTFVTVSHTFEDADETAAIGKIEFTPIAPMRNDTTVVAATVTATLTAGGAMLQKLAANTDPGTTPTGTTYKVVERLVGQPALTYYIQVPHNQGSTLDLRSIAGWVGGTGGGSGTVSSINGLDPDGSGNVVLSASDVGAQPADADLTGLANLADGVPVRASGTWGLASGTRDGTKFLRDDGTWQTATGGTSYTDEQVDDRVNALLVAGPNITKTYDDVANTLTLSAATSGSSGIPASIIDAKGDIPVGTANDTVGIRTVGTNGQALLADSAQTTGLSWGAPAPASHTHAATDLTSGTVATARLGSGTASSGTFLRGDQTFADPQLLAAPVHAVGSSGAALTIDASSTSGWVKTVTLTANCTVTLTGATSGRATTVELVLTQDATGSRTVTWPGSVKWSGGAPLLSTAASAVDRVVLTSYNGGTTWYGDVIGAGYV